MRTHFDEEVVDALYLRPDEPTVVESEETQPGIVLDLKGGDEVVGIETLQAKERIPSRPPYLADLYRHDQERKRVDALLLEGLESGEPRSLTAEDWQEIRDQVRARAAGRLSPAG